MVKNYYSDINNLPLAWVKKEPDRRTGVVLEGEYEIGIKAVLIDDAIGSANTKKRAIENIGNRLEMSDIVVI